MITKERLELEREYKRASDKKYDKADIILYASLLRMRIPPGLLEDYVRVAKYVRRLSLTSKKL